MRVSSLSDERVIRLLSQYFVPSWASRDHYQLGENAAEKTELTRIDTERRNKKFLGGAVAVVVLNADGSILATMPLNKASKPENLVPFLEGIIADHKVKARNPEDVRASAAPTLVKPRPESTSGQLIASYTRFDDSGASRGLSRDHIELTRAECQELLPGDGARVGSSWTVSNKVASKILRHAYPPLPRWDVRESTINAVRLTATVETVGAEEVRVRLEGALDLTYPDRGQPTDGRVKARLVGVVRGDPGTRTLKALTLTSDGAEYVWHWQGKPIVRKMVLALELE